MALTKLSVGRAVVINDATLAEATMLLMRDGRDIETELTRQGKALTTHTVDLVRDVLGEHTVTLTRVGDR